VGLLALALLLTWWGVVRQSDLLDRTDNLRRIVTDRYVLRGSILDRANRPITQTTGDPGSYRRVYLVPSLSPVTGYNDPSYGQAGLEATQDSYLRGLQGNPSSSIWWDYLIYGQPPPGLNLRLSINLEIQELADQLLAGRKGAIVLLNASSGEIMAMSSQPGFDPNQLAETWSDLIASPDAPLLNRAVQGQYPPGPALAPFLLADTVVSGGLPTLPSELAYLLPDSILLECSGYLPESYGWGDIIRAGCPASSELLGKRYSQEELQDLFQRVGFTDTTDIGLAVAPPTTAPIESVELASVGQDKLLVTPLQMALAAAAISNQGVQPGPLLCLAVETPNQGWVALPHGETRSAFTSAGAALVLDLLSQSGELHWQTLAVAQTADTPITWYLGGTTEKWRGSPVALAVILEQEDPAAAEAIGRTMLNAAINGQ
jgi:cell division protein FtsI/penicillin-binding protein 2